MCASIFMQARERAKTLTEVEIMKRFEIGKRYSVRSICDHDCVWSYEVVARTEATVTIKDVDDNSVKRCRVIVSKLDGNEFIRPLGKYSMCPVLRA